jgi:uncharacterized membrane protein YtjA (UPF0391 family)
MALVRDGMARALWVCPGLARSIDHHLQELTMLHYAIVFFVIALIAALFGFGGIAASAVGIAKILFFIFIIIAAVTFLMSLVRKS